MIYFIQDESTLLIKIGFTDHATPAKRLCELQTASSAGLVLLSTIPGTREMEKHIHREFANLRERGEWFRPAPALIRFIADTYPKGDGAAISERDQAICLLLKHVKVAMGLVSEAGRGVKMTRQHVQRVLDANGIEF